MTPLAANTVAVLVDSNVVTALTLVSFVYPEARQLSGDSQIMSLRMDKDCPLLDI